MDRTAFATRCVMARQQVLSPLEVMDYDGDRAAQVRAGQMLLKHNTPASKALCHTHQNSRASQISVGRA